MQKIWKPVLFLALVLALIAAFFLKGQYVLWLNQQSCLVKFTEYIDQYREIDPLRAAESLCPGSRLITIKTGELIGDCNAYQVQCYLPGDSPEDEHIGEARLEGDTMTVLLSGVEFAHEAILIVDGTNWTTVSYSNHEIVEAAPSCHNIP
jgi:hypothetical protein